MADIYELVRRFMRQVVSAAAERLAEHARAAAEPFCGAKPDIDWQDPEVRKARLGELVAVGRALLAEVATIDTSPCANPPSCWARSSTKTSLYDDDDKPEIRQGVAADRVISHSDPEMRHGGKSASRRFDGHKMDVVSDEDSEMVLAVDLRADNAADGEGAAPLLEAAARPTRSRSRPCSPTCAPPASRRA